MKIQSAELLNKMRDPRFYLENLCKIKGKTPGLVPFVLKEAQKDLFNALAESNRVIILKARQLGFSTAATGYFYHDTIMNPGTNTALIGYNTDLTSELLDKVKTFYRTTPPELRPTIHYNSKYEISFPSIDSKIIVLPSTENVGRGYTLHNVLATELAFWDKADEKMAALENSVPATGHIVVESTPNGTGNLFHRMWVTQDNGYVKKEYGWWWEYTKEQIENIRKRMNNPQKFAQEYELEFLTSGRPVFDPYIIRRQRKNIMKVGDDVKVAEGEEPYKVEKIDDVVYYRRPEKEKLYCVGADVAEGVQGGDYSVAVVFDRTTGEEVAFYRGYISADRFGELLDKLGRKYNNALMTVEVNNHGLTTLTILKQKAYPCLYFRPKQFETIGMTYSEKLGWRTTKATRPLLIDDLAQGLRDSDLILHSKDIMDEMTTFVYNNNGDMVSQEGFHDDGIFASGICYQGFKILYKGTLTQLDDYETSHVNYSH